eukprot:985027_1
MGKGTFSGLDVSAMVKEMRSKLIGCRLANVYDLSPKQYLFKLARPDQKLFLILESGIRFHTTKYMREKNKMPNGFSTKLRKHIRTKRLEDIRQLGIDRVVVFSFGAGEKGFHVILEMYSGGNILLVDHKYEILALLRPHEIAKMDLKVALGETYRLDTHRTKPESVGRSSVESVIRACLAEDIARAKVVREREIAEKQEDVQTEAKPGGKSMSKRTRKKKRIWTVQKSTVSTVLIRLLGSGPVLVKHCLHQAELNGATPLESLMRPPVGIEEKEVPVGTEEKEAEFGLDPEMVGHIEESFRECLRVMKQVETEPLKGYIVYKTMAEVGKKRKKVEKSKLEKHRELSEKLHAERSKQATISIGDTESSTAGVENKAAESKQPADSKITENVPKVENENEESKPSEKSEEESEKRVYVEFMPFAFTREDTPHLMEFQDFDNAVDEFYSKQEVQKDVMETQRQEAAAYRKVERVKDEHSERLRRLDEIQENNVLMAQRIEINMELVTAVINAVNEKLAHGMDWNELARFIDQQSRAGNPVAQAIASLRLSDNIVVLKLAGRPPVAFGGDEVEIWSDGEEEDGEDDTPIKIPIDLALGAHANARNFYNKKRAAKQKQAKTNAATNTAMKAAERRTQKALKQVKQTAGIQKIRHTYWFEKFNWFISSENYLVIGGRDAQQNELIVKRYADVHRDIYVHAEMHGASSVIVKNPSGKEVPPSTLSQACAMCVCRSSAWDQKVAASAYWVYANQVSKTTQSGEFIRAGSFVIRGKKNFLPPQPLIMGFTLLFKVDQDSYERNHVNERLPRRISSVVGEPETSTKSGDEIVTDTQTASDQVESGFSNNIASLDGIPKTVLDPESQTDIPEPKSSEQHVDSNKLSPKDDPTRQPAELTQMSVDSDTQTPEDSQTSPNSPTILPSSSPVTDGSSLAVSGGQIESGTAVNGQVIDGQGASGTVVSGQGDVSGQPDSDKLNIVPSTSGQVDSCTVTDGESISEPATSTSKVSATEPEATDELTRSTGDHFQPKKPVDISRLPRGKRTKYKRMLKKYGDQDDEDRKLALEILGAKEMDVCFEGEDLSDFTAKEKRAKAQEEEKKQKEMAKLEEDRRQAKLASGPSSKACFHCGQTGHIFRLCPLRRTADDQSFGQALRREQREIQQIEVEEGLGGEEEGLELNLLTGKPLPDDVLEYPVPMCAPYEALKDYKYRVKVIPGSGRRGKAVKEALSIFSRMDLQALPTEKAMIRSVVDSEAIAAILSNVKVSAPGVIAKKSGWKGRKGKKKNKKKK